MVFTCDIKVEIRLVEISPVVYRKFRFNLIAFLRCLIDRTVFVQTAVVNDVAVIADSIIAASVPEL